MKKKILAIVMLCFISSSALWAQDRDSKKVPAEKTVNKNAEIKNNQQPNTTQSSKISVELFTGGTLGFSAFSKIPIYKSQTLNGLTSFNIPAGVNVTYQLISNIGWQSSLAVETGLHYQPLETKYSVDTSGVSQTYSYVAQYLALPIGARFCKNIFEKISVYSRLGLLAGFPLSGDIKGETTKSFSPETLIGIYLGLGVKYAIMPNLQAGLGADIIKGFTPMYDQDQAKIDNFSSNIYLSVSYAI